MGVWLEWTANFDGGGVRFLFRPRAGSGPVPDLERGRGELCATGPTCMTEEIWLAVANSESPETEKKID